MSKNNIGNTSNIVYIIQDNLNSSKEDLRVLYVYVIISGNSNTIGNNTWLAKDETKINNVNKSL